MNKTALLIPHYNNPEGLTKSLLSIHRDEQLDVFVIDDGSSKDKIDEKGAKDSFQAQGQIKFKYLEKNQGIENALNNGLDWILGEKIYEYIARLDCGDICLDKRFSIQEDFLNKNPDIMLVGANIICVGTDGSFLYNLYYPEKTENIRKKMYLNSMFSHPCSMYRVKVVEEIGKYPTNHHAAEDYAYFFKIVRKYSTYNIQQFLLKYEINPQGISQTKRRFQVKGRIKIILENFYFGFWPIYGLLRNIILYIVPNKLLIRIKKMKNDQLF